MIALVGWDSSRHGTVLTFHLAGKETSVSAEIVTRPFQEQSPRQAGR